MTHPILTKLLGYGVSTVLGGAGLFAGLQGTAPADPLTGRSAPMEVSVASPGVPEGLAATPEVATALSSVDPEVLREPEIARALRDPRVAAVMRDPAVADAIRGIDPAVLSRPAVLDAISRREVTPAVMQDPVVLANLPAIMAAMPVLEAAWERADAAPDASGVASDDSFLVLPPVPAEAVTRSSEDPVRVAPPLPEPASSEARNRGRSAEAHARRDARRGIRLEHRDAARELRGFARENRQEIDALRGVARTALRELSGLGVRVTIER